MHVCPLLTLVLSLHSLSLLQTHKGEASLHARDQEERETGFPSQENLMNRGVIRHYEGGAGAAIDGRRVRESDRRVSQGKKEEKGGRQWQGRRECE